MASSNNSPPVPRWSPAPSPSRQLLPRQTDDHDDIMELDNLGDSNHMLQASNDGFPFSGPFANSHPLPGRNATGIPVGKEAARRPVRNDKAFEGAKVHQNLHMKLGSMGSDGPEGFPFEGSFDRTHRLPHLNVGGVAEKGSNAHPDASLLESLGSSGHEEFPFSQSFARAHPLPHQQGRNQANMELSTGAPARQQPEIREPIDADLERMGSNGLKSFPFGTSFARSHPLPHQHNHHAVEPNAVVQVKAAQPELQNKASVGHGGFPFGDSFVRSHPLPPRNGRRAEVGPYIPEEQVNTYGGMMNTTNYNYGKSQASPVDGGVFLTWQDLWVTASDGKGGRISILSGLSGYAQPGQMLAIMGPSGCGKSTLLDTLAGRLQSNVSQSGQILVNGQKQTLSFGTSAYVTQDDILMTTLTVREAVYYSAQLQLPDWMPLSEKRERAETTIQEMGLRDTMDTRIGGWGHKGISGGQKRRVSICMEILTRPELLFLDEPTSGLDSAASFHVMSRIAELARRENMTVLASIHQPSSEVFELFHNLCLLASGKTIYFGPTTMTSEFFAFNGFPCPTLRNPSDHFLRTINKDFDKDIEQGPDAQSTTAAQAIEMLSKSYKSSVASQQVTTAIAEICKKRGEVVKKRDHASFLTQSFVLTRRSFVNMYRDLGYYWLRFAIYVALCLCVGTLYHDIGHSYGSIQARGAMLMFVGGFLTFMSIGGFPSYVEDMKIFGRERLNGHYGVTSFVIGNTFSSTPYLALISVIPGAMAYYLVGLQKEFGHFIYFALVLFVCLMLVESLMMIVASIVPDFLMGIITGAGIQGVMLLNGGFFRLPHDLPKPVWRYPMYYIAFHKYANQGFFKNEFSGLTFPNQQAGGPPTITGAEILRNTWQVEMHSKWIDLVVLFGMVILYRILFLAIVKMTEKMKPMIKAMLKKSPKKAPHVLEEPSRASS